MTPLRPTTVFAENGLRPADVLAAMGMYGAFRRRWHRRHDQSVAAYAEGGARLSALLATTKMVRQTVQVGTLGLGAWLVLAQKITPGMMIAASIILSRALALIEQGIAAWRGCVTARTAWDRLNTLIQRTPSDEERGTTLPRPTGLVQVEGVMAVPPGASRPVLHDVSLTLRPGTVTAVVGPSGSGKSTLARVLVGVWPAQAGQVRLDGAAIGEWPAERRLQHVGYLPQEVELFEGSLAENVARLNAPDDNVLMRLPEHYDTAIVEGGTNLSAGQRQRVGLAWAVGIWRSGLHGVGRTGRQPGCGGGSGAAQDASGIGAAQGDRGGSGAHAAAVAGRGASSGVARGAGSGRRPARVGLATAGAPGPALGPPANRMSRGGKSYAPPPDERQECVSGSSRMYSPSSSSLRGFSRELRASRSHPVGIPAPPIVIPAQAGIQGMDTGLRRYDEKKRSSGASRMESPLLWWAEGVDPTLVGIALCGGGSPLDS